jgi:Flp pilus assembly protein TadG
VNALWRLGAGARSRESGQALPEFALVLIPFMLLLLGIFDLGRGIYMYNSAAEAAREIARVASVDRQNGYAVGSSPDTQSMKALQRRMVPGLTASGITVSCVDINDVPKSECRPGQFVRVRIAVDYTPITPLLGLTGPYNLVAVSHIEIA